MAVDVKLQDRNGNELKVEENWYTHRISIGVVNDDNEKFFLLTINNNSNKEITLDNLKTMKYYSPAVLDDQGGNPDMYIGFIEFNNDNFFFFGNAADEFTASQHYNKSFTFDEVTNFRDTITNL